MRIPTLDGWRGVAIVLVLAEHVQDGFMGGAPWLPTGRHGVTAFFVLSGYLITGSLLDNPDLKRFYVRRVCRLMPVAWCFLAFVAALGITARGEVRSCLLFFRNYFHDSPGLATGPFWSLSIEEQFYMLWPVMLLLIGAKWGKWVAAFGAVCLWRVCILHPAFYDSHRVLTEVHAPALLVGCFLAIYIRDHQQGFVTVGRWLFWPCVAYLAWISVLDVPIPPPLECLAWGLVICHSAVARPDFLNWRPLTWLGRVSYSVYVWNYPILLLMGKSWIGFAFLALPILSYYWIERPGVAIGVALTSSNPIPCIPEVQHE